MTRAAPRPRWTRPFRGRRCAGFVPRLCVALAALAVVPADDEARRAALEQGRECTARFFAGELQELWERFDAGLRATLGSLENLQAFREQALGQLGSETAIAEERALEEGQTWVYVRKARYARVAGVIEVVFRFDAQGAISGFLIRPVPSEAPSEHLDHRTATDLRLPFEGEWLVFWGGRRLAENYHAATVDQRFAYDLLVVRDGSSHSGAGERNEDYHCFGLPVLAPGAGVVVVARDGVEDNVPGHVLPGQPAGNHVVLDHGNGEFSFLAHFKRGSLAVAVGQRVEAGARLGLCGNSGNSSEPHLHYHLQDTAVLHEGQGLPAQFQGYLADGVPVERGEPIKGQHVRMP